MVTRVSLLRQGRRLFRLAALPAWTVPAIVGLGLLTAGFEGLGLYLFIPLIQNLSATASQHPLSKLSEHLLAAIPPADRTLVLIAAVCGAIILKNAAALLGTYLTRYVYGDVGHRLRLRIFQQALWSAVDYRPGVRLANIIETIASNTWKVATAVTVLFRALIATCTALVFLILMTIISARLTVLALALMMVGALIVHLTTRTAEEVGREAVAENKAFGMRMWESINYLQLIRTHGREAYEQQRLETLSDTVRRRLLRMDMLWALPGPLSEVSGILVVGALIVVGSRVGAGVAVLAAFLAVLYRLQAPAREMMQVRVMLDSFIGPLEDVETFLEDTRAPLLVSGRKPAPPVRQGIELRDVSFVYAPGETPALSHITATIPAHKVTAVVGASGAGKSTLMMLLFRFRDPTSGEILVDGAPLAELKLDSWRSKVGLLSQEPQIFHTSVEENIAYSVPGATLDQVRAAAEIAGATEFIEALPEGFQTVLGDRGARLSGGQKQRIALARTILSDPALLLLDEPTAALDNETERAFQEALEIYARDRTVVVIAHKLTTVRAAHQVIVLDAGRVVETGTPEALLSRPSRFARLHGLELAVTDAKQV